MDRVNLKIQPTIPNFELLVCAWLQSGHPICMPMGVYDISHIHWHHCTFARRAVALQPRRATVLSFPVLRTMAVIVCLCVETWCLVLTWIWTAVIMVHLQDTKYSFIQKYCKWRLKYGDSVGLGYEFVLLCNWFPAFQRNLVLSSSTA